MTMQPPRIQWFVVLVAAAAAVCASGLEPPSNACFELPIVVVSPTGTKLPTDPCIQQPLPAPDCMKMSVQAKIEVVDRNVSDGGSGAHNCFLNTRTSVHDASVHYRGQSSLHFAKHQFGVTLSHASAFLGFPEDTTFVLHGPMIDTSLLRNHLAHWLFRGTTRYSPRTRHVVLYVRDRADPTDLTPVYKGIYLAIEKIAYGPNRVGLKPLSSACRSDAELSGGWAWQINPLDFGVYSPNIVRDQYETAFGSGERPVLTHPPHDVLTQRMRDYFVDPRTSPLSRLYTYLYENMTHPDALESHIDIGSFVDYLLHTELSQNTDAYRRSAYFFKDRAQPINAGPVWDFNLAYGTGANQPQWLFAPFPLWKRLTCNYKFASLVPQRWHTLRASVWSNASIQMFLNASTAPIARQLASCSNWTSAELYCANVRADGSISFDATVRALYETVAARAKWMDERIGSFFMALNGSACVPVGTLPQFNCAANGSDSGCLTDAEKYINAVQFPSVRKPAAATPCTQPVGANGMQAKDMPSIDYCWLSAGVPVAQSTLTPFCSGHGYCEPGPGAMCKCVHNKQPPTCADVPAVPPPVQPAESAVLSNRSPHEPSSSFTASRGFAWGYSIALLCTVFAAVRVYTRSSEDSSSSSVADRRAFADARKHVSRYGS